MTGPASIADFEGTWRMVRTIQDHRAGKVVYATGVAALTRGEGGHLYDEVVMLSIPGQAPLRGTRRYLWCTGSGRIDVRFADGRFFHGFSLKEAAPTAHHACLPDSYGVAYDFARWPNWSVRWEVEGPRKSYVMLTDYARDG
ncbi:hypothetical protein FGK63_14605 [Ruegeria sediminis]|uniref:DUF6314 domain-containing protein n=1 Tax=Ruegeria sediminis TaxID=2583820 RepID=A0ABY2WVP6_9RHOB|nr:DUF6314 family protein [Ruegeria sediminis]TMV06381.1 hypothetical protein FGK63_14605 [Ruegeria sediminis]